MLRPWQVSLGERIDPARDVPIYMQIIQALIRDIERGRLTSGTYLPSSRQLAKILGVNRKTVVFAYEDLIAQGWLESAGTRGTMVAASLPDPVNRHQGEAEATMSDAVIDYRFAPPPERPLALPSGPGLKVDEGAPDGRLFPVELLARAYRVAVQRASRDNGFQYRDPRGSPALREAIAMMLKSQRGLPVAAENICITRGSQNGIFLAAQVLLGPGDSVIVEKLTYEPAVAAFRALGANIVPVGLDEDGIDVEAVEHACRRNAVRAVFVTPHHQFPTTVSLRPERRLRLLDLARQFGFAIIEDDYDHEFHFESQPLLPLAAYGPGHVLYVGSMSKLLLPALRIGYVAAPPAVIDAIAHRVSLTDGMGNALTEDAAAELIENGELRRHGRKVLQIYARRRESFAAEIDRTLGDLVDYRMPDGGLSFWLRFDTDLDQMETRAAAMGLRFAASRSFMTTTDAPRGLRIGFASLNAHEARTALAALREAAG
ncbi:MocR-like pyridoxine biosynthesis transcription factor PdxR [Sphingopyxis sp. 113P3]|uniref:MocR-like pyridoxine biosynthesis transcription factor PdxR n=1 Tax=Sphingopyxis sp. (strain 113P3) TaxID=292913 RepID=UPI0006AD5101|nr:PLP-dependent aminotransferase family protein [Sphingopyxis sp. 113P3]ALC11139.1 GntR family transcriptional regulator [Sphingopyxis sp. 113P3]